MESLFDALLSNAVAAILVLASWLAGRLPDGGPRSVVSCHHRRGEDEGEEQDRVHSGAKKLFISSDSGLHKRYVCILEGRIRSVRNLF